MIVLLQVEGWDQCLKKAGLSQVAVIGSRRKGYQFWRVNTKVNQLISYQDDREVFQNVIAIVLTNADELTITSKIYSFPLLLSFVIATVFK